MATYGYARVSSSDQSTDTQIQKLKAAGCKVIRTEKLSGKSREGRDQLATLLEFIGPGDVLVCVKVWGTSEGGFVRCCFVLLIAYRTVSCGALTSWRPEGLTAGVSIYAKATVTSLNALYATI